MAPSNRLSVSRLFFRNLVILFVLSIMFYSANAPLTDSQQEVTEVAEVDEVDAPLSDDTPLSYDEQKCLAEKTCVINRYFHALVNTDPELVTEDDMVCITLMKGKQWFRAEHWSQVVSVNALYDSSSLQILESLFVQHKQELKDEDEDITKIAATYLFFKAFERGNIDWMESPKSLVLEEANPKLKDWIMESQKAIPAFAEHREEKMKAAVKKLKNIVEGIAKENKLLATNICVNDAIKQCVEDLFKKFLAPILVPRKGIPTPQIPRETAGRRGALLPSEEGPMLGKPRFQPKPIYLQPRDLPKLVPAGAPKPIPKPAPKPSQFREPAESLDVPIPALGSHKSDDPFGRDVSEPAPRLYRRDPFASKVPKTAPGKPVFLDYLVPAPRVT